ncbi:2-C-methyl-D-erythritol 4-phosphate cytidylyltransferase [Gallaecimonas sp. GXIMD4217]|uniref:2-C-methyl-D-erythritol 4-phosphate cytidylyltransferase n=1 Tax=Gallaecimonas sp. GXIMD4217 TaxID=3131927 RepID=UPI00311B3A51
MNKTQKLAVVVPAAGVGRRMGQDIPKQYLLLDGQPILGRTLARLLACEEVGLVVVALGEDDPWFEALPLARDPRILKVRGGAERAHSVLAGLKALDEQAYPWVMVHDAARPLVTNTDLVLLMDQARQGRGAILAAPVVDTMKLADETGSIDGTVPRERLWRAFTPQCFPTAALRQALEQGLADGAAITDEASAMERQGHKVALVAGREDNIKITNPRDLALAEYLLAAQEREGIA